MLCISFPIKVSKFPQFLYLPTARRNAEDQSLSAPTSHRSRRSPEKGAARTFPTEVEALKQLKRNKHKTRRIGPFGASAGDTVSSSDSNGRRRETRSSLQSGSMPSPHQAAQPRCLQTCSAVSVRVVKRSRCLVHPRTATDPLGSTRTR